METLDPYAANTGRITGPQGRYAPHSIAIRGSNCSSNHCLDHLHVLTETHREIFWARSFEHGGQGRNTAATRSLFPRSIMEISSLGNHSRAMLPDARLIINISILRSYLKSLQFR